MKKFLFFFILFFMYCSKEDSPINDPTAILNTQGWTINLYRVDGVKLNTFSNYIFSFSTNETPGCPDWIDGTCPSGVFGGHYFIYLEGGINKFKIVLSPAWNLNEINGAWSIVKINGNIIHLKRLNQEIFFNRN